MLKNALKMIAFVASVMGASYAIGHSGGLDKNGCHNDHKNGGYHCH